MAPLRRQNSRFPGDKSRKCDVDEEAKAGKLGEQRAGTEKKFLAQSLDNFFTLFKFHIVRPRVRSAAPFQDS